ncbi:LacI family DNA-binding transcriptional regulator [Bacillus sp. JJ722]|uniref:LacI family DNA-binding transcriptional regulator n=1 Tax=Bacillus sp. JJ722 TaxID=3122973 RepID=UPI002FFD83E4
MANIKDIAKMAGVSVTTVSRVINNHPYVSTEKKNAVLNAMDLCNYQRNINAVHLSKGQTFLIGVVVPYTNHPYFGQLVEGIAKEAIKKNYKLVLLQTNYEKDREIEAFMMLKHKQIDSLIICSRNCEWNMIEEYLSYGPIILFEDAKGKNVSATYIDHYKSFFTALEYLYNKGHRKIGYCLGRKSGTNSQQRERAYIDFSDKINMPVVPEYIFYDCNNFEDGVQVVRRISEMNNPPTALLVSSDIVAAGILTFCKEKGIEIPNDLAIMGFDNQPIAKIMHITTLEIPLCEIGRKLFIQAVNNTSISREEIQVTLIERQTV